MSRVERVTRYTEDRSANRGCLGPWMHRRKCHGPNRLVPDHAAGVWRSAKNTCNREIGGSGPYLRSTHRPALSETAALPRHPMAEGRVRSETNGTRWVDPRILRSDQVVGRIRIGAGNPDDEQRSLARHGVDKWEQST